MKKNKSRRCCVECPWINKNPHSEKFPTYVESIEKIGKIKNKEHGCHMITKDIWGYNEDINEKNVCVGAKLNLKKSNVI